MVDVARLQVEVDSRQVRQADKDFDRFKKSGKGATQQTSKFGRATEKASQSGKKLIGSLTSMRGILAGLGVSAAAASMLRFANSAITAADNIDNLSRTAGVSAESLQELRFAFGQLAGTTDTEVDAALRRFNRRLGLAADGSGAAKDTFEQLGISLTDAAGNMRDGEVVLDQLLSRLASVENDSRRAALASQAFGEDAVPRLAAALGEGEAAVNSLRDQALVLENDMVNSGSRIRDELDRLFGDIQTAFQGAFLGFATENEQDIRELFGSVLTGMSTVVRASDEVAGPLGAGIMGRVLFGKKGMILGTLIASAFQTVNAAIDKSNENIGQQLVRVEGRIDDLLDKYEGMDIDSYPGAAKLLKDLREEQARLDSLKQDSIDIENQYANALEDSSGATDDLADRLLQIRDRFLGVNSAAAEGASVNMPTIEGPEQLTNVDVSRGINDVEEFNRLLDIVQDKTIGVTDKTSVWEDTLKDVKSVMEDDLSNSITDVIMDVDSLSDAFKNLANQIARTVIQRQVSDPLADFATQAVGSIFSGGGVGGTNGSTHPRVTGDIPMNANGGNVYGDTPSIVGERGPELFVPGQDGRIMPNSQMGGSGDVTVNIINQGGEQMEAQKQDQRRGPNGEMTVDVMVKSSMERLDSQGQLDGIFRRHGAKRQGQF